MTERKSAKSGNVEVDGPHHRQAFNSSNSLLKYQRDTERWHGY